MTGTNRSLLAFALVGLVACAEPTIDASSDESMTESAQKVRTALAEPQRAEFDEAMRILAFSQISMKDLIVAAAGEPTGADAPDVLHAKVRATLDGKTAEQILAAAEIVRAERREQVRRQKERERQQALEEVKELEAKRTEAQRAREHLKRFEVKRSRFYMQKRRFGRAQPTIELTVRNDTAEAVARAYFEGTLASPGRSVPWHKAEFNYAISGGLEPGEEAEWSLQPNMFSEWGKLAPPADAVFTVTVQRVDGAEGKPTYSVSQFSERDQERRHRSSRCTV